jgi:SPX domain protein involved in polyphosphate accumulation
MYAHLQHQPAPRLVILTGLSAVMVHKHEQCYPHYLLAALMEIRLQHNHVLGILEMAAIAIINALQDIARQKTHARIHHLMPAPHSLTLTGQSVPSEIKIEQCCPLHLLAALTQAQ